MEKSTRLMMDQLQIDYRDIDGFTCCPEKSLTKNLNADLWRVAAARNVAVAEAKGLDITMSCTGCFSTLKSVHSELTAYPNNRARVNEKLKSTGLEFKGTRSIKHLIGILLDDVGPGKIKERIKKPLKRMKIAVHGGCHLVRPSKSLRFDDPIYPVKYDQLIELLGAEAVKYDTKMLCCGGYLDRVDQHENGLILIREKLKELKEKGVDAMTVVCPECFKAYDNNQFLLQRKTGERYDIPVITLQELMCLAFGLEPKDLGLDEHRIDTSSFLAKLNGGLG